ncbi:MAG TPA: DNA/RNA non-specific endonuclease, partial [Adhaeribacter sp.]|nr:DNA/RNA non-specific endonuclease [Adhaeribacter sp.]
MKKHFYKLLLFTMLGSITFSCQKEKEPVQPAPETSTGINTQNLSIASGFPENFESGSKTAYAVGNVTFSSGTWTLTEALVGTSTADRKNGLKSVRMRDLGKLTMTFSAQNGASTVSVKHAKYGSDGNSTWELWVSQNGGAFTKVGSTVTTSATTLQTATFTVNKSGQVRFEIRKTSGSGLRINIDDFTIDDYGDSGGTTTPGTDGSHMAMGNPSAAVSNTAYYTNFLMEKPQYALSYNRDRATPNWVSWYVSSSWLGSAPRQDDFRADALLPSGWYQVGSTHYSGSGFDRGHNCPSADRTNTIANNSATFLMTNMIPQAPKNNQQTWANLENYTRTLVDQGNEIYVIMGAYGTGGTGANGYATTINSGKITVPNRIWKVMVVLPNGTNDVSRVTTSTRVIAIDTPNDNSLSTTWGSYRTSVDAIEAATGYNLLSN